MKQWKSANKSGKYRIHKLREPTVQEGRARQEEDERLRPCKNQRRPETKKGVLIEFALSKQR